MYESKLNDVILDAVNLNNVLGVYQEVSGRVPKISRARSAEATWGGYIFINNLVP